MPEKVISLILLSLLVLATAEEVFQQKQVHYFGNEISSLSAVWAGDIEGDGVSEILAGGISYEAGISKGTLLMVRKNSISVLGKIPGTSRTLVMTVCDVTEDGGREIVVGSNDLYIYNRTGKELKNKGTDGDVTALCTVNYDSDSLEEIIYGTSTGYIVYLVGLEVESRFSVVKTVNFIADRGEGTFYVVTRHSIHCFNTDGEELWSKTVQGDIFSAASHDINKDSIKELIYVSSSTVYSLSPDGQRQTTLLKPSTRPLSLLIEDVTDDGKPDLMIADDTNHVGIYSDLKVEVQSVFFGEEESVTQPLVYAADLTGDGKTDLLYGGVNTIAVYENVVVTENLVPRAESLFAEGEEYLDQREYERARAKFEEAERIFSLIGKTARSDACIEYIEEIDATVDMIETAESAYEEGKTLYNEGKYEEAKLRLAAAHEDYILLVQKDSYYQSLADNVQQMIDACDLAIAGEYFEQGEEYLKEEEYTKAREQFEKAQKIYERLGNERAQQCVEKLEYIDEQLTEEPEQEEMNMFLYVGALVVVLLVSGVFLATRKKVSAKLEKGHIYLLLESQPRKALQLVKEYGRLGYSGLVISRLPPEQIRKRKLKKQKILQFSSASKEDSISPDNVVNILLRMKEFMTSSENTVILLDGLDYLAIQNSFEDAFSLVQKLAESVTLYKGIVLVTLNPKSLEEKELVLLEGEMELLEL